MLASARLPDLDEVQNKQFARIKYLLMQMRKTHCIIESRGGYTFLHTMVGISGSPEAAQGMTSSLPASCRYSPPGLTLK